MAYFLLSFLFIFGIVMFNISVGIDEPVGTGAGLLMAFIGGYALYDTYGRRKRAEEIKRKGHWIPGEIIDYMDDETRIIGNVPALDIVVRCEINGVQKVCRLSTGQTSEADFPIGASIMLSLYQGEVDYVPNSVSVKQ